MFNHRIVSLKFSLGSLSADDSDWALAHRCATSTKALRPELLAGKQIFHSRPHYGKCFSVLSPWSSPDIKPREPLLEVAAPLPFIAAILRAEMSNIS